MSPWQKLLERPDPRGHFVQLCDPGGQALFRNVGQYLWEGLKRGDGLLLVATPQNTEGFCRYLRSRGADLDEAIQSGRLSVLDPHEILTKILVGGLPDWQLFEDFAGRAMQKVRPQSDQAGRRAYGEMVSILWNARQFSAAIRLEQFWNKLLGRSAFSLFCAYSIDVFSKEFQASTLDALLCAHTHLVPGETSGNLEAALNLGMVDVLGADADRMKRLIKTDYQPAWAVMPAGEAMVVWLRKNLPDEADKILARAKKHFGALHSRIQ